MKERKIPVNRIIVSSLLIFLPTLIGILLWNKLPEQIPTHFDINNQPDSFSSKTFTVFVIPLIMFVLNLIVIFVTVSDPKYKNIGQKNVNLVLWIVPATSILVSVLSYGTALNYQLNVGKAVLYFMGVLLIVLGNYLPKAKQNYSLGIKTSWALEDEENWNITNRVSGYMFVIGGIATIISTALFSNPYIFFVILLIITAVPTCLSYYLYIKKNK